MRALSGAFITSLNTLLGLGLAPPLVGLMNDVGAQRVGPESIRFSLALMMIFHLAAAGLLLRASSTILGDLRVRERYLGSPL